MGLEKVYQEAFDEAYEEAYEAEYNRLISSGEDEGGSAVYRAGERHAGSEGHS